MYLISHSSLRACEGEPSGAGWGEEGGTSRRNCLRDDKISAHGKGGSKIKVAFLSRSKERIWIMGSNYRGHIIKMQFFTEWNFQVIACIPLTCSN